MDYSETEFVKSTKISQAQGSARRIVISDSQPIVVGCVISSASICLVFRASVLRLSATKKLKKRRVRCVS